MTVLAKIGVGVLGTALVFGAALSSEGFIHVKVQEKRPDGTRMSLIVPAAMIPLSLRFVPGQHLAQASANIRAYLPVIDAAIPALEECSDGVLVEVIDPEDHVLISKSGNAMAVDVNDPQETVHVMVPLAAARSSIHQIAEAGGPL